mmetsp:Transcript_25098/g.38100  ORF Transcript_25098/g.38100 Transcript_25098/m.38100 type:complete len:144 (+) Transcript_25098:40-471(+)
MDQIVGAIKRVISEPDVIETKALDYNKREQPLAENEACIAMPVTSESSGPPAVVEMDETVNANVGRHTSTSSSLSDINDTVEHIQRSGLQLSTGDSSVSSFRTNQNGSGNWGWFEDVHDQRVSKKVKNRMNAHVIPSGTGEGE